MDLTKVSSKEFEDTVTQIENSIFRMEAFCTEIPAPCILYSSNDIVLWYNEPMKRVLYGHNGKLVAHAVIDNVLNRSVTDSMYSAAAEYITKENAKVRFSQKTQYDSYTPEKAGKGDDRSWLCLRFPVAITRVGAILLPDKDNVDFFK